MLIGLAGRAQHGKDTIGNVLVAQYGYTHAAFADKVRQLALAINPVILYEVNGKMMFAQLVDLVQAHGWDGAKRIPQVRRILQNIGEGGRQVLGAGVWVDALMVEIDPSPDDYAITDVRRQNEIDAIHNRGGKVWRVTRPGFDNGVDSNHPSEANVALLDVDADIVNDGTVDDLAAKVVGLMEVATILDDIDRLFAHMQEYVRQTGAHDGNLATLYRLDDIRAAVAASFEFDEAMDVDPVLKKA